MGEDYGGERRIYVEGRGGGKGILLCKEINWTCLQFHLLCSQLSNNIKWKRERERDGCLHVFSLAF